MPSFAKWIGKDFSSNVTLVKTGDLVEIIGKNIDGQYFVRNTCRADRIFRTDPINLSYLNLKGGNNVDTDKHEWLDRIYNKSNTGDI